MPYFLPVFIIKNLAVDLMCTTVCSICLLDRSFLNRRKAWMILPAVLSVLACVLASFKSEYNGEYNLI